METNYQLQGKQSPPKVSEIPKSTTTSKLAPEYSLGITPVKYKEMKVTSVMFEVFAKLMTYRFC